MPLQRVLPLLLRGAVDDTTTFVVTSQYLPMLGDVRMFFFRDAVPIILLHIQIFDSVRLVFPLQILASSC